MSKTIKLIWDFRGEMGLKTAEHHAIHLREYFQREKNSEPILGFEAVNEMHAIAYVVVPHEDMIPLRNILKPHRGEWYSE